MNILFGILFLLLFGSCAPVKEQPYVTLTTNNPLGIVMKNRKIISVETPNAGLVVYYSVSAQKVPPHRKFFLYTSDVINPLKPFLELVSDDSGQLYLASDKSYPLQDYIICMSYQHPGEIVSIWLVSDDKAIATKTSLVPYPLEAFAKDGAEISLTRLTANASKVSCRGAYFDYSEKVELILCSKDKAVVTPLICKNGTFTIELAPPDPTSPGEMLTLHLKRENGELLTLTYPWGRESLNRELLLGNIAKFKEEDHEKIADAITNFRRYNCDDTGLI